MVGAINEQGAFENVLHDTCVVFIDAVQHTHLGVDVYILMVFVLYLVVAIVYFAFYFEERNGLLHTLKYNYQFY